MKKNIQSVIDSTDEYQSLNHANPELRLWYRFMPDDKGTIFNRVWRICRSSHNDYRWCAIKDISSFRCFSKHGNE